MKCMHNTILVQQVDNAFSEYLMYPLNLTVFHNSKQLLGKHAEERFTVTQEN